MQSELKSESQKIQSASEIETRKLNSAPPIRKRNENPIGGSEVKNGKRIEMSITLRSGNF